MPSAATPGRILHVSTWGVPCGIATYCGNLVGALERRGIRNDVFALEPHAWKSYLPTDISRLRAAIVERAADVDLVHIQHEHGLFGLANGARGASRNFGSVLSAILRAGRPVVTTFHTSPISGKRHRGLASLLDPIKTFSRQRTWRSRVVSPFVSARGRALAVVHAAPTRHALVRSGIPEAAVRVVPHGCLPQRTYVIDKASAKQALGIDGGAKLLTIFGFIGHYKGHDVAVKALTHLPPEYHLAICGGAHPEAKDPFFDRLLRLIGRLGLRERVTITGWLPAEQAELFYAATDVCVAPYREGSGLSASGAVTWALSSGRPTVASKIDAFQAIQREAACMLMTTPEQPQELAWAVQRLSSDAEATARLIEASGDFCERNSWDVVAGRTLDIYGEALRGSVGRAPATTGASVVVPGREKSLDERILETQSLDGWCPLEKARALADLVLEAKPACIAEIGVYGGRSIIPMALAAKTYGGTVHGIDPWSHEAALEGDVGDENRIWWGQLDIERIYQGFLAGIGRFAVQDTLRVHRTTDTAALREFADGQIGILHVDGNHSAEVSRRYVEQWGPKVAAGGYLVMDDIDWATQAETVAFIEESYVPVRKEQSWAIYRKPEAAERFIAPLAA